MYHQIVGMRTGFFQLLQKLKKILIDNYSKTLVRICDLENGRVFGTVRKVKDLDMIKD